MKLKFVRTPSLDRQSNDGRLVQLVSWSFMDSCYSIIENIHRKEVDFLVCTQKSTKNFTRITIVLVDSVSSRDMEPATSTV